MEKMKKNLVEESQKSAGETLFEMASGGGKNAIAKTLLMSGVDSDHIIVRDPTSEGNSLLMAAAESKEQDSYSY